MANAIMVLVTNSEWCEIELAAAAEGFLSPETWLKSRALSIVRGEDVRSALPQIIAQQAEIRSILERSGASLNRMAASLVGQPPKAESTSSVVAASEVSTSGNQRVPKPKTMRERGYIF